MRPLILKSALVIAAGLLTVGCSSGGAGAGAESPAERSPSPTPTPSTTPTGTPSASPSGTPSAPQGNPAKFSAVTVSRTGGLAGFDDQYTVTADGGLTVQTKGVAAPVTKKLAAADLAQLKSLVTGAALAAEASRGPFTPPGCRDGFQYGLVAGTLRVSGTDCGTLATDAPTFWKVIQLVEKAVQTR